MSSNEHIDGADRGLNNSADVILELLACGLSAGKVERARQILRKIQISDSVTIDSNSGRLHLYDRDTGLTVFAFLSDLQVPTKRLNEGCLDLVRQLRLPEYLMANTNAKQVANDINVVHPTKLLQTSTNGSRCTSRLLCSIRSNKTLQFIFLRNTPLASCSVCTTTYVALTLVCAKRRHHQTKNHPTHAVAV